MQRFVLPAAITFAFLLGLMLLLRRDAGSEVLPGARSASAGVERDAGDLNPSAPEVAEPVGQREVATPLASDLDTPTAVASTGTATLVVTVTSREGGDAISRVPIFIDEGDARTQEMLVSGKTGALGVGVESDYDGVARFTVPAGVRLRVIPRHPGFTPRVEELVEPLVMTAFGVQPLEVGESREVRVHISVLDGELHLAVRDEVTGSPVAGAELRLSERVVATTDTAGRAVYPLRLDAYSALDIAAPGYGLVVVPLRDRREGQDDPLVVRLFGAATLQGQVLGLDTPSGCTLQIGVSKHELVQPLDRGSWGMALGTVHLSAALDEHGNFTIDGLPPHAALDVRLERGTGRREPLSNDELRLEPGELRTVTWDLGALATIVGRVVDEHGRAVADREVAVEAGTSIVWFGEGERSPLARTRTDDAGRFEFSGLAAGDVVVGVVPTGERDERMAAPKTARHVVLRSGRAEELELIFPGETYLEARVYDALGQPAAGMVVHLQSDHAAPAHARSDASGLVRLGPLFPGVYRVGALARRSVVGAPPKPFEVVVPCDPIEIHLLAGAVAAGRIVDAVTGEPVTVQTSSQQSFGESLMLTVRGLGVTDFRYENLSPGTYHFIAEEEGGRVGVLRDIPLEAGEVRDDLVIPMHPGGALQVTYGGGRGDLRVRVRDGEVVLHEEALAPNALSTCRVPAGSVLVELVVTDWTKPPSDREVVDSRRVDVPADERSEVSFD